jgi:hypothetical protein
MNAWIEENLIIICVIAFLVVIFFVPRHEHKTVVAQEVNQSNCLECVK